LTRSPRDGSRGSDRLAPFGERAVGGDQRAFVQIAARDQFEHQIGVPVRVGQIPALVDHEQRRTGVMAQPAPQSGIAVQRAEIA